MINTEKYKDIVLGKHPGISDHTDPKTSKYLLDVLVKKEERLDAIKEEDSSFLDSLLKEGKKKYQKGLSAEIMDTKTFKYYILMYIGKPYGYYGARDIRTKEIDIKVEQSLKSQGYLPEEIATIFASKRYHDHLEDILSYKSKEHLNEQIDSASNEADEFIIGNNDFKIDEDLHVLQEEWAENIDTKDFIPGKIAFLRKRLLS